MSTRADGDLRNTPLSCSTDGYCLGPGILRAVETHTYRRRPDDPLWRRLRIYTRDPSESLLDGAVTTVKVPFEPLEPGPKGHVLEVDSSDLSEKVRYRRVDLDHLSVALCDGRAPSPSDPEFQQQMVYAVASSVYETFRRALGRDPSWAFELKEGQKQTRLRLYPHAERDFANACYDNVEGAIRFGYFEASERPRGRNLPKGLVFTSLSHDIIVHEMTHALLDGLRSKFNHPSSPDVAAFHEGFADTIAIFQHFSHRDVVEKALRSKRGEPTASTLVDLATQFGQTTRAGKSEHALRSALNNETRYRRDLPAHELGSVLTSAIFEAFSTVYRRKIRRYLELAQLPGVRQEDQRLSSNLIELLADQACRIAGHFRSISIRAVDYCPPVDLRLGEYLRAMITADFDLVPDDPWGYREALVDAFRKRDIDPPGVRSLSQDELLWRAPERPIKHIPGLAFADLQFDGDPGRPMSAAELTRQAHVLGRLVTRPENRYMFGLAEPSEAKGIDLACVQSLRTNRRVSPDGEVAFDLVAEVTQKRLVRHGSERFAFFGGSTIILGPRGSIRYAITKNVESRARLVDQTAFLDSPAGKRLWEPSEGILRPKPNLLRNLHEEYE